MSTTHPTCSNNGETNLNFGNWRYVGLGFVVFFTLIVVEIFGSPFMRNIQVGRRGVKTSWIHDSIVVFVIC